MIMTNTTDQTPNQAMKMARATQKQGQTKEQTKLIARGIEKGIAEYKKQQNKKARERDKLRKAKLKAASMVTPEPKFLNDENETKTKFISILPWVLLLISLISFVIYIN